MVISAVYLSLLLLAVLSWCFSLWKTWKLTTADSAINRTRLLAFGWLLGAPIFIFFTAIYWVSAMRLITDFLVTVVWVWELFSLCIYFSQSALVGELSRVVIASLKRSINHSSNLLFCSGLHTVAASGDSSFLQTILWVCWDVQVLQPLS